MILGLGFWLVVSERPNPAVTAGLGGGRMKIGGLPRVVIVLSWESFRGL